MQLLVNYLLTSHPSSRLDFSLVALANYNILINSMIVSRLCAIDSKNKKKGGNIG